MSKQLLVQYWPKKKRKEEEAIMILAIIEVRLRQVQKHVDHQKFNVASITIYRQHSVTIKYKFLYIYYHMHQVWDTAIAVFQWNNDLYYFSVLFSDFLLVLLTTNFVIKWMIYWLYWLWVNLQESEYNASPVWLFGCCALQRWRPSQTQGLMLEGLHLLAGLGTSSCPRPADLQTDICIYKVGSN